MMLDTKALVVVKVKGAGTQTGHYHSAGQRVEKDPRKVYVVPAQGEDRGRQLYA